MKKTLCIISVLAAIVCVISAVTFAFVYAEGYFGGARKFVKKFQTSKRKNR